MEILVLFNSKGGNVYALAKAIAEGINQVDGMGARLRRVKETTPIEVIRADPVWSAFYDKITQEVPEATHSDILETEGLALGSPTRFGNIAPAVGNFLESLGGLWAKGAMIGKVGGVFTSTSTMHGGQEATLLTMMIPLMHMGYIIVPMGFIDQAVANTTRGGTPYGPSSVSGNNSDEGPNDTELHIARMYGKRLAEVTRKLRA